MRLRVGVVGFGYWGSKHVRVLHSMPDVDVVVIDNDASKLAAAQAAFPGVDCVADFGMAVRSIDAAVLATSPSSHAPLATIALEAGVHVLVEKPLATSSVEAVRLVALAADLGLTLMVGHTFEYNASVRMLRDLVVNGDLGEIRYIDSARLNLGLYQPDVNVIWDLAPHDVSINNFLLGSSPDHVSAWATRHIPTEFEDVAYIQMEYSAPDVRSYAHLSWLDPQKVRRVTVVGSEKMAVYNDVDMNEPIRIFDVGVDQADSTGGPERPLTYRYGDIHSPRVSGDEPLAVEDRHFLDCIRTGSTPLSDGPSGLAVVRVVEAAVESAANSGQRVSIDNSVTWISPRRIAV